MDCLDSPNSDFSALVSPAPKVTLVNAFSRPLDNAIATARTCYSSRIISTEEVARDDQARALRDRIARETWVAGHHTTRQHATFQFALENVSRQFVWSFLHAHPFYNSDQTSQRYVEVKPDTLLIPRLPAAQDTVYRRCAGRMMATYHRLIDLLTPRARDEYLRLFPGHGRDQSLVARAVKKKVQEIARYVLPLATFTQLYHTINGLTLYRYRHLAAQYDVPTETALVINAMVQAVHQHDPLFFRDLADPLPLSETLEYQLARQFGLRAGDSSARAFAREFDASLGARRSLLVDYGAQAPATLAQAVRTVLGLTKDRLTDEQAISLALAPQKNPFLCQTPDVATLSKVMRALSHAHYVFRKKLSHSADSQDQRHRLVPGSRPILLAQYAGGEPDVVVPDLIDACPEALDVFQQEMTETFADIDRLLAAGVDAEHALYLLPNAFPIRFEESGELLHLRHKWSTRLCYTAQEEIWRASKEEVEQVRAIHPGIGMHLKPPCQIREQVGIEPRCPEGSKFCGVPVWRLPWESLERTL